MLISLQVQLHQYFGLLDYLQLKVAYIFIKALNIHTYEIMQVKETLIFNKIKFSICLAYFIVL